MKIVIAGSRTITDMNILVKVIKLSGYKITEQDEIVSGGARGVDTLAEMYAKNKGIPLKIFKPDWNKYGKSAGVIRNYEMAKYCDAGIVIHNGSNGSINMIKNLIKFNKAFFEYKV
ncbi:MAG: DUF2493 domain-containing protein [Endomicrobiaceae bacterium]|nr:DUF2493 domain-containing protein [Endomicrobiaceae bacterium]